MKTIPRATSLISVNYKDAFIDKGTQMEKLQQEVAKLQ